MNSPTELKYVVISDLHLGETDSLFTPPKDGDHQLVHALSGALAELIGAVCPNGTPEFIFNGDILGLAFSGYDESLVCCGRNRPCIRGMIDGEVGLPVPGRMKDLSQGA